MSHRKRRLHSPPSPPRVTLLTDKNLRDRLSVARRERHYDERRQFDLPSSKLELPHDFISDYPPKYSRVDGSSARVRQGLPINRNRNVRESDLSQPLHSYFQDSPRLVSECVRRQERRRVLFALQRTRKGSGRGKRHNWNDLSKVRCV